MEKKDKCVRRKRGKCMGKRRRTWRGTSREILKIASMACVLLSLLSADVPLITHRPIVIISGKIMSRLSGQRPTKKTDPTFYRRHLRFAKLYIRLHRLPKTVDVSKKKKKCWFYIFLKNLILLKEIFSRIQILIPIFNRHNYRDTVTKIFIMEIV